MYRPLSATNEADSAEMTADFLSRVGADAAAIGRARSAVLATRHDVEPASPDEALLLDVDLATLGGTIDEYAAYERGVRREYRVVPGPLYRRKRRAVLEGFLGRDRIYRTAWFSERFEAAARRNLAGEIARLNG